jgi:hypothetical protein
MQWQYWRRFNRNEIQGMEPENYNYKIMAATALGALGGLLLASYLCRLKDLGKPLSKHVAILGNILEQIEDVNSEEAESLKERIENILTTIESAYGNPEE